MRDRKYSSAAWLMLLSMMCVGNVLAQTINISEDFTGTTTNNSWYTFNGACLTASGSGTATGTGIATSATPGIPPGCTAIQSSYYNENLVGGYKGASGSATTLPDTVGYGALRFTNGCINGSSCSSSGGHNQNGAIISGLAYNSNAGIQITFKTTTYRGDSDNGDGADGMSFFLIDGGASVTPNIGSWGGSLGYTCSNTNTDYHGMVGAYIGLGIDEFGNFLNGSSNTLGTSVAATGDNTASGGGPVPNRIGMRGAGNIAFPWLLSNYGTYYNKATYTGSTTNQNNAVKYTCQNGYLSDYNGNALGSTKTYPLDYPAIPNAFKVLSGVTIANEYSNGGYARPNGTTVPGSVLTYKLQITPAGLLSFSYSVNGGSWLGVLANQNITASNGALPTTIRFGFAGSTGGGSNIHEVMCFKAVSLDASSSSASSNLQQSSKITGTTQAYFAYYNPNDWTGRLTANLLTVDSVTGNVDIASTATWDASCVLTSLTGCTATGSTAPTTAEAPTSRVILSWNGTTGVPFEWGGSGVPGLSSTQETTLDAGDSTQTAYRLNYLRGDRTEEVSSSGTTVTGLYRDRDNVLGDIVDSSPVAVGQPSSPYAVTWKDKLFPTASMEENSGTQNYTQFYSAEQTRQNVVYVGANDGLLHGFRAGSYDTNNNYVSTTNDGTEVLGYMPAAVVNSIHNSSTVELDYSNTQYGHNFYVDATPGTGDLFYNGSWHTWLVGGLGAGGASIYALDVTDPTGVASNTTPFAEGNASSLVLGEWGASNITCSKDTSSTECANNLGNTFGTPAIRRLHNGSWAVIFGNGFGSATGDAGIYVAVLNPPNLPTFYYLSTGTGTGTTAKPCTTGCNGIAYVTPVDLDGDHITDYVYAGDLLGNVWRFDLTSNTASVWAAGSAPLFAAGTTLGQPITSSLLVALVNGPPGTQVIVAFGTGQQTQLTNTTPVSYASAKQSLYAVWDWNFAAWNAKSGVQYASLSSAASGLSASNNYTITPSNLTAQTLTENSSAKTVDIASSTICWTGTTTCSTGPNNSFGWLASLPGASEQIIYNPELVGSAFVVNSTIPANNTPLSCSTSLNTGYTYAITLGTGAVSTTTLNGRAQNFFVTSTDSGAVGLLTNATGTSIVVTTTSSSSSGTGTTTGTGTGTTTTGGTGSTTATAVGLMPNTNPFPGVTSCGTSGHALVYQNTAGAGGSSAIAVGCPLSGQRVSWSQKR